MLATTRLKANEYKVAKTPAVKFREQNLDSFILKTLQAASLGYDHHDFIFYDLVASTYGKYAVVGVNLTQAVLDEHKVEWEREPGQLDTDSTNENTY
ncbi:MAG: hypothetical protein M1485_01720 [Chloroflexi bacterium]|nr:hypothetical protein [Chloroflexota bacterium]